MKTARTVVFADLSGSSRLFGLLGTGEAARFMTQLTDWMVALCPLHGGRVVKSLGDGVLLVFEAAHQALEAAVALQRGHRLRLQQWPAELRLPLRIGMASGEIVSVGDDCYGEAVNLAARLSDLAGESQIWAVESVLQGHAAPLPLRGRDLGFIGLRGISGARKVFQIEWDEGVDPGLLTLHAALDPMPAAWPPAPAAIELRCGGERALLTPERLPIHVGRGTDVDFVVRGAGVSRRHARIAWVDGSFLLTDLSSYGTWLRFAGSEAELRLRRTACVLYGSAEMALGAPFADPGVPTVRFSVAGAGLGRP